MPELPEVDTVAEALDKALQGRKLIDALFISRLRKPFDAGEVKSALAGRTFRRVRRRAKYIIMELDGDYGFLAHLGMTGSFRLEPGRVPHGKHDRIVLKLDKGDELRYADPRRFGFVSLVSLPGEGLDPLELASLGCEPLERTFTAKAMQRRAEGRGCPIKVFIMDQTVVVGVGNIYASEALFLAGIDPRRAASSLDPEEWKKLVAAIRKVLREALRAGGSTIRNYRSLDGSEGGFQRRLRVYGNAGGNCPLCGSEIAVERLGGRSTFYCQKCQI